MTKFYQKNRRVVMGFILIALSLTPAITATMFKPNGLVAFLIVFVSFSTALVGCYLLSGKPKK